MPIAVHTLSLVFYCDLAVWRISPNCLPNLFRSVTTDAIPF